MRAVIRKGTLDDIRRPRRCASAPGRTRSSRRGHARTALRERPGAGRAPDARLGRGRRDRRLGTPAASGGSRSRTAATTGGRGRPGPARRGDRLARSRTAARRSPARRSASRRRGQARSTSRAPAPWPRRLRIHRDRRRVSTAAVDPRTRDAGARSPTASASSPFARPRRPASALRARRRGVAATSRTRSSTASRSRSGRSEFWRSPLIDQDASLVAFVGDELAAMTMIRDRRAERPRAEQRHRDRGERSAVAAWRAC